MRFISFLIIFISLLYSKNTTTPVNKNFIDILHNKISKKINKISTNTDNFIAEKLQTSAKVKSNKVDNFFKDDKYIEETNKSFIRISTNYAYNSLGSDDFNANIHAKIDLRKSSKNLKLFISDLNSDNTDTLFNKSHYKENSAAIGVSLTQKINRFMDIKYSLGIRSLYPFAKARFSYKKQIGKFEIEPVQNFSYSTKDDFKEDTRLYIDNQISNDFLFRTELGRGSKSKYSGMDYDATFHLFWTPKTRAGLVFTQAFYGNTHYEYTANEVTGETKRFKGINNYVTQVSYRQNIYKKWIFYQLTPGVNFAKSNNYKANYSIHLKLDFLF